MATSPEPTTARSTSAWHIPTLPTAFSNVSNVSVIPPLQSTVQFCKASVCVCLRRYPRFPRPHRAAATSRTRQSQMSAEPANPGLGAENDSPPAKPAAAATGPPWGSPDFRPTPSDVARPSPVPVTDAMSFFRAREGKWESRRVTHHLAFRRSESGTSEIEVTCLDKSDPRILDLLNDHNIPSDRAHGGCYVTWKATMAWDQEGENHEGSTVFALVPDLDDNSRGKIFRDRGYAEIVPIAGTYYIDKEHALCLETPYDGGAVEERFCFESLDLLYRVSTVRRFGGLSNATFATETRISPRRSEILGLRTDAGNVLKLESVEEPPQIESLLETFKALSSKYDDIPDDGDGAAEAIGRLMESLGPRDDASADSEEEVVLTPEEEEIILSGRMFLFGDGGRATKVGSPSDSALKTSFVSPTVQRAASIRQAAQSTGRPSPGSAFSSGFGSTTTPGRSNSRRTPTEEEIQAGIDLSKVPPSMRDDFERSLRRDSN